MTLSLIEDRAISLSPLAAIDIGTNTIRLLIATFHNRQLHRIITDRAVTRLGKGLGSTKRLNKKGMLDSLNVLFQFKKMCTKYGAKKIIAVGTSALREAKNSADFLTKLKNKTGIETEIISGEKEAFLTLKGILGNLKQISGQMFITDIGGGSTEWIINNSNKIEMGSIPIGSVNMYEQFIKNDPPLLKELEDLKNYIYSAIKSSGLNNVKIKEPIDFIATGGTATTLAAIDLKLSEYDGIKINLHKINIEALNEIYKRLIFMPIKQRLKIPGLELQRADIIIVGTLILKNIMEFIKAKEVIISDYGLLEGVLIDYWNHCCPK